MRIIQIIVFIFLSGIILSGCVEQENMPIKKITFADTGAGPLGILLYVAKEKGFFYDEGLDVTIDTQYAHGQANIEAILRGDVFIGTASETPVMRAGLQNKDIVVIATMGIADRHLAIVGRKDRGIGSPKDIVGKKLGVTIGSNAEYFFDVFSIIHEFSGSSVEKVHTLPISMAESISEGRVDAIVSWFPNWKKAEKALGENAAVFFGEDIYSVYFNIIADRRYVEDNQEIIEGMLRAFVRAEKFSKENPEELIDLFGNQFNLDQAETREVIDNYHLVVELNPGLITALENQARWAIRRNLTDVKEVPNYLKHIHFDALENVRAESVNIIH